MGRNDEADMGLSAVLSGSHGGMISRKDILYS
jgi:hypothetical protein